MKRLLIAVLAIALPGLAHAQATRPNVVVIMTDDMGYADLGSYGASDIRTPNIDSLARDGVKLTDFHSNGVLCTPTRAGFISGHYQQRYALERALPSEGAPGGELGLPVRGHSLPHLLKNAGYATALVGKWHLGYKPEFSPNAHGFDYFFGLKSGYFDYYTHASGDGRPDLWENDTPIVRDGYSTDLITARAVSFIEQQGGRPFFLDLAYNAPHWPYQVPDRPSVAPDNARHVMSHEAGASTRADYVAMMERVDRGVGDVLRTLERRGLAANTIVIFTSDNGGEWLANNGPLFHRKWTVWEGGIRVPLLVRWPGRMPKGTVSAQVGITMDLTAAILAAAGAAVPAGAAPEGIDLFPILQGKAREVPRTLFWRAVMNGRDQRAVRHGDYKLIVDGNHTMLFNVRADIGERTDLARQRPEVVRTLHALLVDWEKAVGEAAAGQTPAVTSR